jgi:hypothetical protein
VFQGIIDLLLGGDKLSEDSLVLVLMEIFLEGLDDEVGIVVDEAPELLELMTAVFEGASDS